MRSLCWHILIAAVFGGGVSLAVAPEVAEAGRINAGSPRPTRSVRPSANHTRRAVPTTRQHTRRPGGRSVVGRGTRTGLSGTSPTRSLSRHRQPTGGRISTHAVTAGRGSCVTIGYRPNRHNSHGSDSTRHQVRRHYVHRRHHYPSSRHYSASRCTFGLGTIYGRSYNAVGLTTPTVYLNRTYPTTYVDLAEYSPSTVYAPPVYGLESPAPTTGIDSFLQQGDTVFRAGKYDDARRLYIRALLANGDDVAARLSYGWSLFALGRYSTAADAFRQCLTDEPDLLDGGDGPLSRYGSADDLTKHRGGLERHVAAFPHDAEALFLLGYIESRLGESAAAVRHLHRVVELDERDTLSYLLRDASMHGGTTPEIHAEVP